MTSRAAGDPPSSLATAPAKPVQRLVVGFPGGLRISAHFGHHEVTTDQPVMAGGEDSAPSPFELFLVSLATCAGLYAQRFLAARSLPAAGLGVELEAEPDPERPRIAAMRIRVRLPAGFPERYRDALVRAIDQCAVKRHLVEPPTIRIELEG